jgi:hypothetical protein
LVQKIGQVKIKTRLDAEKKAKAAKRARASSGKH